MSDEYRLTYEIEITKQNIPAMLSREIIRLMTRYGSRAKDCVDCFVLPPSAFIAFREWGREYCRVACEANPRGMSFEGIPVTCGYVPFVQFAFKPDGWHIAHSEAKRFISTNSELDA